MILGDDEAINEAGEIIVIELKEGDEEITPTCNSLGPFGLKDKSKAQGSFPNPLLLECMVKGMSITLMVETGASHNFISPILTEILQLSVDQNKVTTVKPGNDNCVTTTGMCKSLEVQLGNFPTRLEAYILELEWIDMILGVVWLHKPETF